MLFPQHPMRVCVLGNGEPNEIGRIVDPTDMTGNDVVVVVYHMRNLFCI